MFYNKINPLTQILSKDNIQWQFQRNILLFEGCYSTVFMIYITENYNAFLPLHIPMKEHDNIMGENNRRENIESVISVSIIKQDPT